MFLFRRILRVLAEDKNGVARDSIPRLRLFGSEDLFECGTPATSALDASSAFAFGKAVPHADNHVVRDDRDYKLDIAGLAKDAPAARSADAGDGRPYLSVRFACCNVYARIYRSTDSASYHGRCPKCLKPVKFVVGEGGSDARVFVVQ